jgi:hypothetical protein
MAYTPATEGGSGGGGRGAGGGGQNEETGFGGRLRGRMGGAVFGCDLDLVVDGVVPPLFAALGAVVAYLRLLEARSHSGGGSHHSAH